MKTINVEITGTAPLLMNKYDIQSELDRQKGRRTTKTYDSEEDAKKSAYWSSGKKKELIIPSVCIYASMLNASAFYRVQKKSAKSVLAGSMKIEPFEISLGTDKYEIDVRPVVIQRSKVLKSRALVRDWEASFQIVYNDALIGEPKLINDILTEAGLRIGILDFRPAKSGPFGTFKVTKFEVQK